MITWKAKYKCRLCGETFTCEETQDGKTAMMNAMAAANGTRMEALTPSMHTVHLCLPRENVDDNRYGIADFLGFERYG